MKTYYCCCEERLYMIVALVKQKGGQSSRELSVTSSIKREAAKSVAR